MFFVFNKEKIASYIVAFSTVAVLLTMSIMVNSKQVMEVSASSTNENLPIYNVQTEEKKVALTMNCAWNADDIDSILETLDKCQVKITFFIVGDWADKYPEAVRKIYEHGHEIGNHSNTHPHVNKLSLEKNVEEIEKASEKLKKITGQDVNLYRCPYGEYNDTVINAAKQINYYTIQWSLDTLDYTGLTGDKMWERLDNKLKNGDIILMHNGTDHTADSLEMIIKNIQKKGYEVVKTSDLIYKDNYEINSNGTQVKISNQNAKM